MTNIIAVANRKGGVGTATTCANLDIGLPQEGACAMQPDLRRLSKQQNSQTI